MKSYSNSQGERTIEDMHNQINLQRNDMERILGDCICNAGEQSKIARATYNEAGIYRYNLFTVAPGIACSFLYQMKKI